MKKITPIKIDGDERNIGSLLKINELIDVVKEMVEADEYARISLDLAAKSINALSARIEALEQGKQCNHSICRDCYVKLRAGFSNVKDWIAEDTAKTSEVKEGEKAE